MFKPSFCPNPECQFHSHKPTNRNTTWYSKDGFYNSELFGKTQRYKCKNCKHRFSEQTFSMNYHIKKKISYRNILDGIITTSSISDIARKEHVSPHTIINRERRMAVQAITAHSFLLRYITTDEPIVCDGFQSVVRNFYFPNNLNIAIGKNTQYFYSLTYAQIKRAGLLTDEQKSKKQLYEKMYYVDYKEIENSFSELITIILNILKLNNKHLLMLYTDKKPEYSTALKSNRQLQEFLSSGKFQHIKISSKEPRTINNPLFAVNYMDRQFRKDLSEHVPKSICFGRNVNNQLERMAIYRFYHNYIKSFRVRKNKTLTHSDMAGIPSSIREYYVKRFFNERLFHTQICMLSTDQQILNRSYPSPLIEATNTNKEKADIKESKIA